MNTVVIGCKNWGRIGDEAARFTKNLDICLTALSNMLGSCAENTWESKENVRKRKNQYLNGPKDVVPEPTFKKPNLSHNAGEKLHRSESSVAKTTSANQGKILSPDFKQTPSPPRYTPHKNENTQGHITASKESERIVFVRNFDFLGN